MQAIDFKALLRDERKKKKKNRHSKQTNHGVDGSTIGTSASEIATLTVSNQQEPPVTRQRLGASSVPTWPYSRGFLSLQNVASLDLICDNPRSILYASLAFSRDNNDDNNDNNNADNQCSAATALQEWLQQLPSGDSGLGEWKTMNYGKRQVCMFGMNDDNDDDGDGDDDDDVKAIKTLPEPLQEIADQLVTQGIFPSSLPPNHVLLNKYRPGQGILHHTDGPLYQSRTATISLASPVLLEFTKRLSTNEIGSTTSTTTSTSNGSSNCNSRQSPSSLSPLQVLLEPNSIVVFQDDAYLDYCHGIQPVWQEVTTDQCLNALPGRHIVRGEVRYSLTFRHKKKKNSNGSNH